MALHVVLIEPEIPPNTGNVARLCAVTHSRLHLVGPLGFQINDATLRRAGMDYWEQASITTYPDWAAFHPQLIGQRVWLVETGGDRTLWDTPFLDGDYLLFGKESKGLPASVLEAFPGRKTTIPMPNPMTRSLNLSTAAGIAVYEALRQIHHGTYSKPADSVV
ncbi:MAG: tRNA (cytidine(34)-2'-O)-methyltransferase [Candidatus Methylacidiphilales bacterium]|nr:tRNA (cytidine(34)-2'-O)-methyltransferase [Candidatus Methylacidiphilales bacterium]